MMGFIPVAVTLLVFWLALRGDAGTGGPDAAARAAVKLWMAIIASFACWLVYLIWLVLT